MTISQKLARAVTAFAAISGLVIAAACSGGGSAPPSSAGTGSGSNGGALQNARATIKLPVLASQIYAKNRTKPNYITQSGDTAVVVTVVPADPAEQSQWQTLYGAASFTLCYQVAPTPGTGVTVTAGPPVTVGFNLPAPPGNDTYNIFEYAGDCSTADPYAAPTPAPGSNGGSNIIAETTTGLTVNVFAGQSNNINVLLTACGAASTTGGPCTNEPVSPSPPPTTITLSGTVASVYLGGASPSPSTLAQPIPLPIQGPISEQGAFITAASSVGFPLPVVGLSSNGYPIPYTAPVAPATVPTSGLLPDGANNPVCTAKPPASGCNDKITITYTETGGGTGDYKLYLVDATTGAIAQSATTTSGKITLTQINALDTADAALGGTVGDPYVLMATFDGAPLIPYGATTDERQITVTLNATIAGTAIAPQTLTIDPQGLLATAVVAGDAPATGYADASAPYTKAADVLNIPTGTTGVAAGGDGYWVTDGGTIHQVGGAAAYAVTGATTLTGETLDDSTKLTAGQILAVDNSTVAGAETTAAQASGVYVFDPVAHTSKPLAIQDLTTNNFVKIAAPQAIAFVPNGYVYVFAGNTVYAIDPTGNGAGGLQTDNTGDYYLADEIGTVDVTGLNAGSDTGFDVVVSGTKLIFPDTGNNRIVEFDTASCLPGGASCSPTVVASGDAFVGLSASGLTGGNAPAYFATDTKGELYGITSSGSVSSFGLQNGAAAPLDGIVGAEGQVEPYSTQGGTANFFNTSPTATLPYTLSPFAGGKIFAPAAVTAIAGGTLKLADDTSYGTSGIGTNPGAVSAGFGIAYIAAAGANTALTSNSWLFTDKGSLRTLIP